MENLLINLLYGIICVYIGYAYGKYKTKKELTNKSKSLVEDCGAGVFKVGEYYVHTFLGRRLTVTQYRHQSWMKEFLAKFSPASTDELAVFLVSKRPLFNAMGNSARVMPAKIFYMLLQGQDVHPYIFDVAVRHLS